MIWVYYYLLIGIRVDFLDMKIPNFATNNIYISFFLHEL